MGTCYLHARRVWKTLSEPVDLISGNPREASVFGTPRMA